MSSTERVKNAVKEKIALSVQAIDCILYNRHAWQAAVELFEPRTSTSIVMLPVSRPGDPVGAVAVSRATVTFVLDIVDQTLKRLPREYRRIAKLKWDDMRTHKDIANIVRYSEKTVERRVDRIRNIVKNALESLGGDILPAFWREIDGKLSVK